MTTSRGRRKRVSVTVTMILITAAIVVSLTSGSGQHIDLGFLDWLDFKARFLFQIKYQGRSAAS